MPRLSNMIALAAVALGTLAMTVSGPLVVDQRHGGVILEVGDTAPFNAGGSGHPLWDRPLAHPGPLVTIRYATK